MSYEWLYKLDVICEDKDSPGWYKLGWKPIKNGTYNIYVTNTCRSWHYKFLGIRFAFGGAHNGWGRSWDDFAIDLGFIFFDVHFWVRWNFLVMAEGPGDGSDKKPLDLSRLNRSK